MKALPAWCALVGCAGFLSVSAWSAESGNQIDPHRMSLIVKTLASDEFEGRAPGTTGEARTLAFLAAEFSGEERHVRRLGKIKKMEHARMEAHD